MIIGSVARPCLVCVKKPRRGEGGGVGPEEVRHCDGIHVRMQLTHKGMRIAQRNIVELPSLS